MTEDKRRKVDETISELDLRLDGLLGKLGRSLGEMIERLDGGEAQEVRRSHEVETPRGPLRAEAGLRVRFTATGAAPEPAERARRRSPKPSSAPPPVDPEPPAPRPRHQAAASADGPEARTPEAESYVDKGHWHLCADLPGATLPEIDVQVLPAHEAGGPRRLVLRSEGARRYAAERELPTAADPSNMDIALRNGVLVISMRLSTADSGEEEPSEAP